MDAATIGLLIGGIVTVLGALTASIVAVITALRSSRAAEQAAVASAAASKATDAVVSTTAEAARTHGVVLSRAVNEIRLLVDGRTLIMLRDHVALMREKAESSGSISDADRYQTALGELHRLEASAMAVERKHVGETAREVEQAETAAADVKALEVKATETT